MPDPQPILDFDAVLRDGLHPGQLVALGFIRPGVKKSWILESMLMQREIERRRNKVPPPLPE